MTTTYAMPPGRQNQIFNIAHICNGTLLSTKILSTTLTPVAWGEGGWVKLRRESAAGSNRCLFPLTTTPRRSGPARLTSCGGASFGRHSNYRPSKYRHPNYRPSKCRQKY
jgi:hypothetical protein